MVHSHAAWQMPWQGPLVQPGRLQVLPQVAAACQLLVLLVRRTLHWAQPGMAALQAAPG